jgi:hypothetical protein
MRRHLLQALGNITMNSVSSLISAVMPEAQAIGA